MPRELDLDRWPRRAHFELFRGYESPFWNVCTDVDVDVLYRLTRSPDGPSFFLATLYLSLAAVNESEVFRYRLRGDRVVVHDVVHAGPTVLRPDETFGFAFVKAHAVFATFARAGQAELERVAAGSELLDHGDDDLVYYSVLPWIRFTSFAHARRRLAGDSIPSIVFGRHHDDGGRRRMPVSVDVHHALVDGLHVARFLERFQARLDAAAVELAVAG